MNRLPKNISVLKIVSPTIETLFVAEKPIIGTTIKTPHSGHILARTSIETAISVRTSALRILGYKDSPGFEKGLLIATPQPHRLEALFGKNIGQPQDELCDEVIQSALQMEDVRVVFSRIERVRLMLHPVTADEFRGLQALARRKD